MGISRCSLWMSLPRKRQGSSLSAPSLPLRVGEGGHVCWDLSPLLYPAVKQHRWASKLWLFPSLSWLRPVSVFHKMLSFDHRPDQEVAVAMTTKEDRQQQSCKGESCRVCICVTATERLHTWETGLGVENLVRVYKSLRRLLTNRTKTWWIMLRLRGLCLFSLVLLS